MANLPGYNYWDYVIGSSTTVAIVNEDSDYPAENAQNYEAADCTRSTDKTTIKYRVTLPSATYAPKLFSLVNHNFSGGTLHVYSYTAADWSTGKKYILGSDIRANDLYCYIASTPSQRKYWEFDLSYVTNSVSFYEFGRAMIYDNLVTFPVTEDWKIEREYIFENIVNRTRYGVRWAHEIQEKRERFGLNWTVSKEDDLASTLISTLRTMYENMSGDSKPCLFMPKAQFGTTELVSNGGFDSSTTSWYSVNNATLASVAGGKSGNCLQITENGAGNPGARQEVSVTAGDWYYFEVFADAGTEDEFWVYLYDVDNSNTIIDSGTLTESAGDWSQGVRFFFQAPAGCASIYIFLLSKSGSAEAKTFKYDSVSIKQFYPECYYTYLEEPTLKWTDVELGEFTEGVGIDLIEAVRGKA